MTYNKQGFNKAKAIALLSGGLDSTLAVKLILDQGIEVLGLNFVTPFCTCNRKGCKHEAKKVTDNFDISLKVVAPGEEYISLVRNPKYGHGKNINPCIDCRILMFSHARKYMEETGAYFVFTGEVLGERPMSQRLEAMKIIERESGLEERLLRPLSAQHFPLTLPEKEGLVDRDKLLAIKGRSRKPQMALAKNLGVEDYPCPAGGCRLTDPNYAKRLKEAFEHNEESLNDVHLLRYGRHFRLGSGAKVIVGRNESENETLKALVRSEDILLEVKDFVGPVTLLRYCQNDKDLELAASLCLAYSDYQREEPSKVKAKDGAEIIVKPMPLEEAETFRI